MLNSSTHPFFLFLSRFRLRYFKPLLHAYRRRQAQNRARRRMMRTIWCRALHGWPQRHQREAALQETLTAHISPRCEPQHCVSTHSTKNLTYAWKVMHYNGLLESLLYMLCCAVLRCAALRCAALRCTMPCPCVRLCPSHPHTVLLGS